MMSYYAWAVDIVLVRRQARHDGGVGTVFESLYNLQSLVRPRAWNVAGAEERGRMIMDLRDSWVLYCIPAK